MITLMLTQRGGSTANRVLDNNIRFSDFHEIVAFENFGKDLDANESNRTVYVPHSDTTYSLISVAGVEKLC